MRPAEDTHYRQGRTHRRGIHRPSPPIRLFVHVAAVRASANSGIVAPADRKRRIGVGDTSQRAAYAFVDVARSPLRLFRSRPQSLRWVEAETHKRPAVRARH